MTTATTQKFPSQAVDGLVSLLVDLEKEEGDTADLTADDVFYVTNSTCGGQNKSGKQVKLMSRLFVPSAQCVQTRLVFQVPAGCQLSPGQEVGRAVRFNPSSAADLKQGRKL